MAYGSLAHTAWPLTVFLLYASKKCQIGNFSPHYNYRPVEMSRFVWDLKEHIFNLIFILHQESGVYPGHKIIYISCSGKIHQVMFILNKENEIMWT